MNKLYSKIKEEYGNINNFIEAGNNNFSISYVYKLCNGDMDNVSIKIAREFRELLHLESMDELCALLYEEVKDDTQ